MYQDAELEFWGEVFIACDLAATGLRLTSSLEPYGTLPGCPHHGLYDLGAPHSPPHADHRDYRCGLWAGPEPAGRHRRSRPPEAGSLFPDASGADR